MSEQRDVIAGRYRLLDLIGSGGMGYVWLAWDERLSRAVAIKQLRPLVDLPEADAEVVHARAMREARITARLHHPNAVPVFDVVDHEGAPCLVMQYVPSRSLHEILAADGTLRVREAAAVGAGVAAALAMAHEAGIVHRDVKPGNILIANDGTPLLTDFGISRAFGDASLTSTGMLTGTPAYLAPEVARGGASTPAADVFSLGSTLYAAVEGTPPFGAADNPIALLHRVASTAINPPRRAGTLSRVLLWMLAGEPEDRPTMEQAAKALEAVAAGAGDTVPLEAVRPSAEPEVRLAANPAPDQVEGGRAVVLPVEPLIGAHVHAADDTGSWTEPDPEPSPIERAAAGPPPGGAGVSAPGPAAGSALTTAAADPSSTKESVDEAPPRRRAAAVLLAAASVLVLGVIAVFLLNGPPDAPTDVAPSFSPSTGGPPRPSTATTTASSSATVATTRPRSTASTKPGAAPPVGNRPIPVPSRTASPGPPTSASPAPSGVPSGAELAGVVRDYYSRLPQGTDAGWSLLTTRYRTTTAGSRQTYERFWNAIASVRASDVAGSSPASVVATLRYTYKDGRTYVERTSFTLVRQSGRLKIDRTTVLSSRQL